jgi:hypothetical protein
MTGTALITPQTRTGRKRMPVAPRDSFKVGDRFKMSALGAKRPRLASKVGTVTAKIQNSRTVSVRFDGNKRSTSIHQDYIEPD